MKTITIVIVSVCLYISHCLEYPDKGPTENPVDATTNPTEAVGDIEGKRYESFILAESLRWSFSGGNYVCFKNREKGLPWPIGNPRDIAGAIFHGSHCVDAALDYVAYKSNRTAAYLHVSHCRTIVKMALQYFEEHPKYR